MPLLTLTNISLQYGTHQIFDGIDLTITRGQRLGLLGRNGAGKSTLMKLLAGLVQADSGERWQRPSVKLGMLTLQCSDLVWLTRIFQFVLTILCAA